MTDKAAAQMPMQEQEELPRALTKKIPLMECFGPTIQGEGALCGVQTYFLRFGLCDYKCTMCDSMHAVDPKSVKANAKFLTQSEIIDEVARVAHANPGKNFAPWMTLSGGNPCMHELGFLVDNLHHNGLQVNVETQGTLCPEWLSACDLVTISPKSPGMGAEYEPEKLQNMLASLEDSDADINIKVVVFSNQDLEFAAMVFEHADATGVPYRKFLSLGNPYPPGHQNLDRLVIDLENQSNGAITQNYFDDHLKIRLLDDYRLMCEEILLDKRFSNATFLPQLHVLCWANKAEV